MISIQPKKLPVYQERERILKHLTENQVIVVESPTGSGKTTQLPIILHEAGYSSKGVIGITQPRRIAAVSVSEYIAKQLETTIPGLVGYKMRFEDHTDQNTRIKIMTDGILLQEMKADYNLSRYSVIVVDEAHERSLNIDFILGLLKRLLEMRKEFKVLISSATINAEVFSHYFGSCPVVRIDARMYPVDIKFTPPKPELGQEGAQEKINEIITKHARKENPGDVLIFMPGERAIKECIANIGMLPASKKLHLLPLYARLSSDEQERVFLDPPEGKIKVVVATNIAETSVTVDGITCVIDPGLAKMNYYNPRTFTSSLIEGSISKASSNQRTGRAGRTRPGECFRLYTKADFEQRPLFTLEEIYRTDLSEVVLRMAEIGITDFESFDFISSPGRENIKSAVRTLLLLDALSRENRLSPTGIKMAAFPLLPRHSRIIVEAILKYPQVIDEAIIATSFLTANTPFLLPQGEEIPARQAHHTFRDPLGDFVSYLKMFKAYKGSRSKKKFCDRFYLDDRIMAEIANIKDQLEEIVRGLGVPLSSGGPIADYLICVSRGLIQFVCVRSGSQIYRSLTAEKIQIHPGSVMFRETPRYIVAGEIVRTSRMYARSVSPLNKEWLENISPSLAEDLKGEEAKRGKKKDRKQRDTTWQLNLGHRIFKMKPIKGKKKCVLLPWKKLDEVVSRDTYSVQPGYSKLRGTILYNNYQILNNERLINILRAAKVINPETDILRRWPSKRSFDVYSDRDQLIDNLDYVLKLGSLKRSTRNLGVVALFSNNKGTFWFRSIPNFAGAVSESLASLESLADFFSDDVDKKRLAQVNRVYRKLSAIFEE